jgi:hypothetical protein
MAMRKRKKPYASRQSWQRHSVTFQDGSGKWHTWYTEATSTKLAIQIVRAKFEGANQLRAFLPDRGHDETIWSLTTMNETSVSVRTVSAEVFESSRRRRLRRGYGYGYGLTLRDSE